MNLHPTLASLLGTFARYAETFSITDLDGNPTDTVVAGNTIVHGPWQVVTKDQIARVTGIVTESMLNTRDKEGNPVYEFQGNGWRPQASVGDVLLQDVSNPNDRWACKPNLFGGTGWVGSVQEDGSITYAKPGKPLIAIEVPEGTLIESLEGARPAPAGCLLTCKAGKGDFMTWTADVVEKYVRKYNS